MQADLFKAKFGTLPPQLDPSEDDEEEELDSFDTSSSSSILRKASKRRLASNKDYSPLSASTYFTEALEVDVGSTASFRVYYTSISATPTDSHPPTRNYAEPTPAKAPWLKSIGSGEDDDEDEANSVLFICVHGAGYSGLSYACFAKEVEQRGRGRVGVLTFDSRGHGKTIVQGNELDMSLTTLANDLVDLLKSMFPDRATTPKLLLIGHSMGGAIAVEACPIIQATVGQVIGITILDVVEGSALEALEGMNGLISNQPKGFESVEAGIEWHIRTKTLNNLTSARLSVPPLLADRGVDYPHASTRFGWKVDLMKTEPYWKGWFVGLSAKFLACRTAKLLILAGADRLDKELMIGQMQGKFQLEVYRDVGHCLQEDAPDRTAATIIEFWQRNDRSNVLKGVRKVGEI